MLWYLTVPWWSGHSRCGFHSVHGAYLQINISRVKKRKKKNLTYRGCRRRLDGGLLYGSAHCDVMAVVVVDAASVVMVMTVQ